MNYIDFYIDRNNNGILDEGDTKALEHTFITKAGAADQYFTLSPGADVPAVEGYQLLARHYNDDIVCYDMIVPLSTVFGPDEVCAGDTAIYTAPTGMNLYDYNIPAVSGTAPIRIPLEGNNLISDQPDKARYVFTKAGNYVLSLYYFVPDEDPVDNPIGNRIMTVRRNITVHERPEDPELLADADTTVCDGSIINLPFLFSLIDYDSSVDTLRFYTDKLLATEFTSSITTNYSVATKHDFYVIAVNKTTECVSENALFVEIIVDPLPVCEIMDDNETVLSDLTVCPGSNYTFYAPEAPTDTVYTYSWTLTADASIAEIVGGATDRTVTVKAKGTCEDEYTIGLVITNQTTGCVSEGCDVTVEINIENDFSLPADGGSAVSCAPSEEAPLPTPPSVNDGCNSPITPTGPIKSGTYPDAVCGGTIIYTWTYEDCNSHSHEWKYVYTISASSRTASCRRYAKRRCADRISKRPIFFLARATDILISINRAGRTDGVVEQRIGSGFQRRSYISA
ncbi:hypothetical protein LJB78_01405, partial [Bacteroidales bacterium OttesenSCG-928-J16]|nr:hypothetical protein [Bacteroidales bacterium OttesenSCG-928-J16]